MRIAFLSHYDPRTGYGGEWIRARAMLAAFVAAGWEVDLVCPVAPTAAPGDAEVAVHSIGDRSPAASLARATATGLVNRRSFLRCDRGGASVAAVGALLDELRPDLVFVNQPKAWSWLPERWWARSVVDTHNDEAARMGRIAESSRSALRRLGARTQVGPTRRYEDRMLRATALVVACTDGDAANFRARGARSTVVISNGYTPSSQPARARRGAVFVGSLGYGANVDGLLWFVDEVLPRVSGLEVDVVGTGASAGLARQLGAIDGVTLVGEVADTAPYFRAAQVSLVPIAAGGGSRIKIFESLAQATPVLTTSVGAEGSPFGADEGVVVSDDADRWVAMLDGLVAGDQRWPSFAALPPRAMADHSWPVLGARLVDELERLAVSV